MYLPCTYDSPCQTTATKPVAAFDEAELANLLLRMCPESWQDQYDLTQDSFPQSVRKLLGMLENVEKVVVNSNANEKAAKESAEKSTGKCSKGKRPIPTTFESLKRKESRKAARSARNMGARTQLTIPVSVISTIRTELYKRVSVQKQPLDRNFTAAVRKNRTIPSRRLWNASQNSRKRSKRATKAPERRSVTTKVVTLVIPTPNRIVGTVVL